MLSVPPGAKVEIVSVAEPLFNEPVPSTFEPCLKVTVSPFGGVGVTTAVKTTGCSYVEGFSEDVSVVVVLVSAELKLETVASNRMIRSRDIFIENLASLGKNGLSLPEGPEHLSRGGFLTVFLCCRVSCRTRLSIPPRCLKYSPYTADSTVLSACCA